MNAENKELTNHSSELKESKSKEYYGLRYVPAVDIVENDDELKLYLDMPGVDKNDIDIKMDKNILSIKGQIAVANNDFKETRIERRSGYFARRFDLANTVDKSRIEAKSENGQLIVTLPKAPELKPVVIPIQ